MKEIIFWEKPSEAPDAASHKAHQHQRMNEAQDNLIRGKDDLTGLQFWRLHTIDMLEKLRNKAVHGNCLEIGSGKGLASAYLSSKTAVENVTALDYSLYSLEYLLPKAHSCFKGANPKKIIRVFGSFNNIQSDEYDFVFGFGAIHNSDNLESTFNSIYRSLKMGGVFMSSDMALNPSTSNILELELTNRIVPNSKTNYGVELSYRETNDYFRNIVDYIYFSKNAGFQTTVIVFSNKGSRRYKLNLKDFKEMGGIPMLYPAKARGRYDKFMLICEKVENTKLDWEDVEDSSYRYTLSYYLNRMRFLIKHPSLGIRRILSKFKRAKQV